MVTKILLEFGVSLLSSMFGLALKIVFVSREFGYCFNVVGRLFYLISCENKPSINGNIDCMTNGKRLISRTVSSSSLSFRVFVCMHDIVILFMLSF